MAGRYMTNDFYKLRDEVSRRRPEDEINKVSSDLQEILETDIAKAFVHSGRDYITFVPERKCGKTRAILAMADKYGLPIITRNGNMAHLNEKEAKKQGLNVLVKPIGSKCLDGMANVFLLDQDVSVEEMRDRLRKDGLDFISIVGIN